MEEESIVMTAAEFTQHLRDSLEEKYFLDNGKFAFGKGAVLNGLDSITLDAMYMEFALAECLEDRMSRACREALDHGVWSCRKIQAVSNFLQLAMQKMYITPKGTCRE